jgi:hypothetical protein
MIWIRPTFFGSLGRWGSKCKINVGKGLKPGEAGNQGSDPYKRITAQ